MKKDGSTNSLSDLNEKSDKSFPSDIMWEDISFSVGESAEKPKKQILESCWGSCKAGEVCAIMGPSGAGKSSLLNVLAGRSAPGPETFINGLVQVGGKQINPATFKKNIAYVMQDDSLMATSTAREALTFSARLRLDPATTDETIEAMVNHLLDQLGISECADTMIGSAMIKGISGGQRKRASVGVEIITQPSLLFLDEPTSGLDSFSAHSLVKLLKTVAGDNTAVLCTIHQPSSEVFHLFDKVIFMKEGKIFYQGPVDTIIDHYGKLGYPCPSSYNPADFIMSLSQTLSDDETKTKSMYMLTDPDSTIEAGVAVPKSPGSIMAGSSGKGDEFIVPIAAGYMMQLYMLFQREIRSIKRDKGALIGRFGVTIFLNLLFGLIFLGSGSGDDGDSVDFNAHFGGIVMVTISSMFGSAQPVMIMFPFERPMFMREYATGTYSALSYFVVKTMLDAPLTLATTLVQYILCYFMIGLQGNFFVLVGAAWGLGCASASCGMALGCAVGDVSQVTELAPVIFVPQLLFAGFFIQTDKIPIFLRWAQYLCAIKYSLNIILQAEFGSSMENCQTSEAASMNCARALDSNSIEADMTWFYVLMLLVLFIGFRLLAAAILIKKAQKFY